MVCPSLMQILIICRYQKAAPLRFRSQPLGGINTDASGQVCIIEELKYAKHCGSYEHRMKIILKVTIPRDAKPGEVAAESAEELKRQTRVNKNHRKSY